jgi:hypothetical protein
MQDFHQESQNSEGIEFKTQPKKSRASKDQWVIKSHYSEILYSWDLNKCLDYLAASESTEAKLPGCNGIPVAEIKTIVKRRIIILVNYEHTDSLIKLGDLNLTLIAYVAGLNQSLIELGFSELKLPDLPIRLNSNTATMLEDFESIQRNNQGLIEYMDQRKKLTI